MKERIKRIKENKRKKRNTLELNYQCLKNERVDLLSKVVNLQDKVIYLQDKLNKQQEELLEYRNKRIQNLKKGGK